MHNKLASSNQVYKSMECLHEVVCETNINIMVLFKFFSGLNISCD